jgi:hypothetical protein
MILNVPGPFVEARASIEAFIDKLKKRTGDLKAHNHHQMRCRRSVGNMADVSSPAYRSFLWQLQTTEGGLLLIGGICGRDILARPRSCAGANYQPVSFADIHDSYELDAHLSGYLEALGTDIAILGASVFVPGTFSRCGGIIGSPRQSPSSASMVVRARRAAGTASYCGPARRPGVAFQADRILAEQVFQIIMENRNATIPHKSRPKSKRILSDRNRALPDRVRRKRSRWILLDGSLWIGKSVITSRGNNSFADKISWLSWFISIYCCSITEYSVCIQTVLSICTNFELIYQILQIFKNLMIYNFALML